MTQKVTATMTIVHEDAGQIAQGESTKCKKCIIIRPVNDNTYPSLNKAIQQNKIELNNKINQEAMQGNDLKNLATKNCH